jgi:hypothetical protein
VGRDRKGSGGKGREGKGREGEKTFFKKLCIFPEDSHMQENLRSTDLHDIKCSA